MEEIRLQRGRWKYDPSDPLGPEGGFGAVFRGEGDGGETVAVKRLKLTADEAAHRELEIADELSGRDFHNVLPVFDSGQDAESGRYFIVMPEAEHSLQQYIEEAGYLSEADAARTLVAIARGIREVPELVHRDLKPANVLWHSGRWRIADFGIAKFVQDSTSVRTVKRCLSPPYAAPEQWRLERAVPATDIYALGCIGYTLLTGSPPFNGPSLPDYRHQHLNDRPPNLSAAPQIRSLLTMMLRKTPDARPSLGRVLSVLEGFLNGAEEKGGKGMNSLAKAGAMVAERESKREAESERKARKRDRRIQLAEAAMELLGNQVNELFDRIEDVAPAAQRFPRGRMVLGQAEIKIVEMSTNPIAEQAFPKSGWDVVAGATIEVNQSDPPYVWSSSLWYAKRPEDDEYRWREASYFANPMKGESPRFAPYSLDVPSAADAAHGKGIATHQVAWGPSPVDDEDAEDFFDRWLALFAKAVDGRLRHPRYLPLH
jgi:serine/threonine-protein kinase